MPAIPAQMRAKYRRRLEKLVAMLRPLRFRMPDARRHLLPLHAEPRRAWQADRRSRRAEAASQYLITEHSIVTVPWDDAGPFLRFSVTYEAADEAAEDALNLVIGERGDERLGRVAGDRVDLHQPESAAGGDDLVQAGRRRRRSSAGEGGSPWIRMNSDWITSGARGPRR